MARRKRRPEPVMGPHGKPLYWLHPVSFEMAAINRAGNDAMAINVARHRVANPAPAAAEIRRRYPGIDPTIVVAATQVGIGPDHPALRDVVQRDALIKERLGATGGGVGEEVEPDSWMKRGGRTLLNLLTGSFQEVGEFASGIQLANQRTPGGSGLDLLRALPQAARDVEGGTTLDIARREREEQGIPGSGIAGLRAELAATSDPAIYGTGILPRIQNPRDTPEYISLVAQGASEQEAVEFVTTRGGRQPLDAQAPLGFRESLHTPERPIDVDGRKVLPLGIGRFLASTVSEPGTRPFHIASGVADLAANIFLDPTSLVVAPLSKAAKASKLIRAGDDVVEEVGGIRGLMPQVHGPTARQFLDSRVGNRVTEYLAGEDDFATLYTSVFRGRVNKDVVLDIAKAETVDDVRKVLEPELGVTIRATSDVVPGGVVSRAVGAPLGEAGRTFGVGRGLTTRLRLDDVRLLGNMPGRALDAQSVDGALGELNDFATNAKFSHAEKSQVMRSLAEVGDGDFEGVLGVAKETVGILATKLRDKDFSDDLVRKTTTLFEQYAQDVRAYFIDEIGDPVRFPGSRVKHMVDGEIRDLPTAHLLSEFINRAVPLPDARAIRKATRVYAPLRNLPGGMLVDSAGNGLHTLAAVVTEDIWKPLALMRGAWTTRVIAEEQLRMAASGLHSAFRHPIDFIGYVVSRDSTVRPLPLPKFGTAKTLGILPDVPVGKIAGTVEDWTGITLTNKGARRFGGELMDDAEEYVGAMSRKGGVFRGNLPGGFYTGDWVLTTKGEADFLEGAATEYGQLVNDVVARRVARLGDEDLATLPEGAREALNGLDLNKEWFWSGGGRQYRERLARDRDGRTILVDDEAARAAGYMGARDASDRYIDTIAHRIQVKTGGNADLVEGIHTGVLDGVKVRGMDVEDGVLHKALGARMDDLPNVVKVARAGQLGPMGGRLARVGASADRVVDAMFDFLMSKPTNALSRGPAFKQFYWQRGEELLPFMDQATQQRALADAVAAKLPKATIARMRKVVDSDTAGTAIDDILQADTVAKAYALQETKNLLYDATKRGQFFDATRVVFPFGNAWQEIMTSWGRILKENPVAVRRTQQLVEGAEGNGFFYTDPSTGKLVFNYPGGGLVSRVLFPGANAGVDLVGFVQGLNIGGQILPGVGPVVQFAVSEWLADKPGLDWLKEWVLPFGGLEVDDAGDVIETGMPAWMRHLSRFLLGSEGDRLWLNTNADVMKVLATTGDYDLDTHEGWQRLTDDAKSKSRWLFFVRGLGMVGGLPTGPSIRFWQRDQAGQEIGFNVYADEWRQLKEKHGGDTAAATKEFTDRHGFEPWLLVQGKSVAVQHRSVTKEGARWEGHNPDKVAAYPNVIGLFAPTGGPFDIEAWSRQFDQGARQALTPEQFAAMARQNRGDSMYWELKQRLGDRTDGAGRAWLAEGVEKIQAMVPGWTPPHPDRAIPGISQRVGDEQLVDEVRRAVNDPVIAETEAGKGARVLIDAYDQAKARSPKDWTKAKSAEHERDWWRAGMLEVLAEYPEAAGVANVLNRTLADDELEEEAA